MFILTDFFLIFFLLSWWHGRTNIMKFFVKYPAYCGSCLFQICGVLERTCCKVCLISNELTTGSSSCFDISYQFLCHN